MLSKEEFVVNNTTDLDLKSIYAGIIKLSTALDASEDELVDALVGNIISEEEASIIKQFIRNQ